MLSAAVAVIALAVPLGTATLPVTAVIVGAVTSGLGAMKPSMSVRAPRFTTRIVWLFSLVLGHSRFLFARYVLHQDLQTLLRCHMQAFTALGGVPIEILYDRMKTAVTGEDDQGHIVYNRSLLALARHYRFQPRACRPYRAKTKGKVERPFRYIRQDFFVGRRIRNL